MSSSGGPVQIPTIRGRIAERLQRSTPRNHELEDELSFPEGPGDVLLRTTDERGVVALACLILENLREHGGTRAPARALDTVLRKTLATFGPKEVMDIEIEAYEILLWIGRSIDPNWQAAENEGKAPGTIDESCNQVDLIHWAIASKLDLEMDYYSRGRGEFTHRRITPISLEAETYLHAYCHLRRDERVFRLTRIGELRPQGGWPKTAPKPEVEKTDTDRGDTVKKTGGAKTSAGSGASAQMSLLDEK